ncbi:MAG: hypothetical protein RBS39_02425 [Phycisphaerales bacterium]|jgi:hypothetical protein|nr:hypothetical protein [Phycisphaerales bacterium]
MAFTFASSCAGSRALASTSPGYSLVGIYVAPSGTIDVLPDGRLVALSGDSVLVQDALHASTYTSVGSIQAGFVGSFGASFFRVSPDGTRFVVGNGEFGTGAAIGLGTFGDLGGSPATLESLAVDNFDAHWAPSGLLYVAGAGALGAGVVEVTPGATFGSSTSRSIITNIGGPGGAASGGITVDGTHLYTANGFDFSPSDGSLTGDVHAFALSDIASAISPLDFEADGTHVARVLSGNDLAFDVLGNLVVAGGDFFGEQGFVSVLDASAVASTLGGGPFATSADGQQLNPNPGETFYNSRYNASTQEILIFSQGTVYRYAIPSPAGSFALVLGLIASRRRRRDPIGVETGAE